MTVGEGVETTLVVFCRRPEAGVGKQRLAAALGAGAALKLSELFLATTLEDVAAWPGPLVIAPADPRDQDWAGRLPGADRARVLGQPPGNLGERLADVDRRLREAGFERLLYVGTDAPVLTPADYEQARAGLDRADVVLGPALDGGVTLMGSRRAWPPLADLPWSEASLHAALAARCEAADRTVRHLPVRYDVDVPADLARLCADLPADGRPARQFLYRALCSLGYCSVEAQRELR